MPVAWFIASYRRDTTLRFPERHCAVMEYQDAILADLGGWSHAECLGDAAVVKVNASSATLATIAADPAVVRIPLARLDDPLSSLTAGQQTAIRNRVLALGYTGAELNAAFPGGLAGTTLRDVLRFVLGRRLQPRYDVATDSIIVDGPVQPTLPVEVVDGQVA